MFGINEIRAMISASDARALRQHQEAMEELHDLNMQIEGLHDVLERAMAELTPRAPLVAVTKSDAKLSVPMTKPTNAKVKK